MSRQLHAETGMNGAPRTPDFAADERAISLGVRAMAGLLTERLAARSRVDDRRVSGTGDATR
ncbi:hypothetical protein AB0M47_02755 [Hamadaea sp. NPDC051192]|uniref:hypothetical protein n=1 Tax=Hamadaea sp. NPDC051192 TaxID=3154940 RepID=UPI00342AC2A3